MRGAVLGAGIAATMTAMVAAGLQQDRSTAVVATDEGSYLTVVQAGDNRPGLRIVDRGTPELALASVCDGESASAVVVRLDCSLEPPCLGLERATIRRAEPVLVVHPRNTWARPVDPAGFARMAALATQRPPTWSDLHADGPAEPISLYCPTPEDITHASFVAAVGGKDVAQALECTPYDLMEEQADDPYALAWMHEGDAARLGMRILARGAPVYVDVWCRSETDCFLRAAAP